MFITYQISIIHSCPEDQSSGWINIKHSEVQEILRECFPGVSGRSWTVALTAVRLSSQRRWSRCTPLSSPSTRCTAIPPYSPSARCSPMRTSIASSIDWRVKNGLFLPVGRLAQTMLSAFLRLDGALQHALSELAEVWDQFKIEAAFASLLWSREGKARLYRYARRMSVTRLSFSPNKLIDYSPVLWSFAFSYQQDTYVLPSNKPVASPPLPYPSPKKLSLLDRQLEAGVRLGAAKNETRGLSSSTVANLLSLYGRIHSISLSLRSDSHSRNMPLRHSSFSRSSISRCGVSTNTGATACLHCSCLSCSTAQLSGSSEYVPSRSSAQHRLSRIRYNVVAMGDRSRSRRKNFFEMLCH